MLKQHRFLIPIIIIFVIFFSFLLGWWLSLPRGDELPTSILIEPSSKEESGVSIDTSFHLSSGFSLKENSLRSILELDPVMNYTLTGSGKNWTLTPVMPLRENMIYTFRVKNHLGRAVQSFAFQTRSDLLVSDVYPKNESHAVDIHTGIEIRFNRPGVDLSKGFEMLPPVSGHFESQEYSCRFIPDTPLSYNSIYRITLKNLMSQDGAVLKTPYTFSFETEEKEDSESWNDLSVDQFSASYVPGDEIKVRLYGGERQAEASYTMTLHKYPGINAYADTLRERNSFYRQQYGVKRAYHAPTEGLDEIMNTEGQLMRSNGNLYAPLPDNLSEGYYLFTLSGQGSGKEQYVQQMIQVVNLGLYMQSVHGDTLFWIGDPVSNGPAQNILVEVETDAKHKISGQADENGLVLLKTKVEKNGYITVIHDGTPVWFSGAGFSAETGEHSLSHEYYTALYMDRGIYQPGDSIHFWGVVKPRTNAPVPKTLWVHLTTGPSSTLSGVEVPLKDGIFSGVLEPGPLLADSYNLTVTDADGEIYTEQYLSVSEYTKPAYRISLTTEKDIYYYGETVNFNVSAQYYDGTPVAGAKLTVNCYEAGLNHTPITLDKQGKASFAAILNPAAIQPGGGRFASWQPTRVNWWVDSADEQPVNLNQWASLIALPSKIAAEMVYKDGGSLSIQTAVLDDRKIKDSENRIDSMRQTEFQRLQGVPADIPMTLVVHKSVIRQIQTGTWYDYVNRRNVPVYETKIEETVEKNIPVSTVAGKAELTDLPVSDSNDVTYWYELCFAGGVYGDVCEISSPVSPYRHPELSSYTFFQNRQEVKSAPGDTLQIQVWENNQKVENPLFLYTLVQDKIMEQNVTRGAAEFTMEEKYFPNVWLAGAYFDGHSMHVIQSKNLSYDYSQRTLEVKAEPDKEKYSPGESMNVKITLMEKDGTLREGKAVIGVVDESIFDLAPQNLDLAGQLYKSIYYPYIIDSAAAGSDGLIYNDAATAADSESPLTGGGMDGGDASVRTLFMDTAAFKTIEVPTSGAETSIKLPDNITSWRITAAAVTRDLKAGDTIHHAVSSLPFYLQTIVSDTYLTGDDISVSALAVGTVLHQDTVHYTAVLSSDQKEPPIQKSLELPAGERAAFNFGKLAAGSYQAVFSAQYGEYSDSVTLPVSVTDTGLLLPVMKTVPLTELSSVQSSAWPVETIISDIDSKPAFDSISWLASQRGHRTEHIVGAAKALELYNSLLPSGQREHLPNDPRLEAIQGEDGGISPLPEAEESAALTSLMLIAAPEFIRKGQAVDFLHQILKDPSVPQDDRIMAYVGLAAVKEPVLLELQRIYEENKDNMKPYLRLYTGAAFAILGDFDRANQIYDSIKTIRSGNKTYVEDPDIRASAAALLLAANSAKMEEASEIANYLTEGSWDNGTEGALPNLELLAYVRKALPKENNGKFLYEENGKSKEVELKDGMASLILDEPTLRGGNFRAPSGKLIAAVKGFQMDTGESSGDFATITKVYEPVNGALMPGKKAKVTVTVKFNKNSPYGMYTLTDAIPSGLRWLGGVQTISPQDYNIWPSLSQDGQRISGVIYRPAPNGSEIEPIPKTQANAAYTSSFPETEEILLEETEDESILESPKVGPETDAIEEAEQDSPIPQIPVSDSNRELKSEEIPQPENPYSLVFTYYLSAALPGSYITESTCLSWENETVKSNRGTIIIAE